MRARHSGPSAVLLWLAMLAACRHDWDRFEPVCQGVYVSTGPDRGACLSADAAGPIADAPSSPPADAALACPDNLLANPSFETGTDGWGGAGGPITQVSEAHDGDHAARKCYDGSDTHSTVSDNPDTVMGTEVGSVYAASAWLRSDDTTQNLVAVIRVKDSLSSPLEQSNTPIVLQPDWQEVTVQHTVEDLAAAVVEVYFSSSNPADGDCFLLDHICFRPVP